MNKRVCGIGLGLASALLSAANAGAAFTLTSQEFADNGALPASCTCDGANQSPALSWNEPPQGTKSLALTAEDLDAPGKVWVHWVMFDIPTGLRGFSDGVPRDAKLGNGAAQGKNDFGKIGYDGPCPPSGRHRYRFQIYALDKNLGLDPGSTRDQVLQAAQGHILGQAELTGTYSRQQ